MPELLNISLTNPDLSIEPGAVVEVEVIIHNDNTTADSAALDVEFGEPTWVAIPVAGVALGPGESRAVRILFRVPRSTRSLAGDYPFVVSVRSLETGVSSAAQGALHVRPYHAFDFNIQPLRNIARPLQPTVQYDLRLENQGNAPEIFDLSVLDPENRCVYQLPSERVEVGPGEVVEVPLTVQPRRRPWIAPPDLSTFRVKAEPLSRGLSAESAHGNLEFRALCTPFVAFVIAAVLAYSGYWLWQRSQAPQITEFKADPAVVLPGDPCRLMYVVSHATILILEDNTHNVRTTLDPGMPYALVQPAQTTQYTLIARSSSGDEDRKPLQVTVQQTAAPPPPVITFLRAVPPQIQSGQSTVLSWRISGVQTLMLAPLGKQIDPALPSLEVTPTATTTYTLVARGAGGTAYRSVTVDVTAPPNPAAPHITMFSVTPGRVRLGEPITLSWDVTGAATVNIDGFGPVESQGSRTFQAERSTEFVLTAVSPSGAQIQGDTHVEVIPPPQIASFSALPASVTPGQTAQLAWKTQNADSVTLDGVGNVDKEGSLDVNPLKTTAYTLTAQDSAGHSTQQTVTVIVADHLPAAPPEPRQPPRPGREGVRRPEPRVPAGGLNVSRF